MKRILYIIAAAAALAACSGVVSTSSGESKGPKGDLAYFDLRGRVKSMHMNGADYNFDQDGRLIIDPEDGTVDISYDEESGLTYYTYTPVGDDPFMYWGDIRPYRRGYDSNGVLREIAYHYEMIDWLYYNEDGTICRDDWVEESWGGCSFYNYVNGIRSLAVGQSGDIVSMSGALSEDILWDSFVCYSYDNCGNWVSRFGVTHYNGNVYGNASFRTIEYYSEEKPGQFQPALEGLILSGTIGTDASMCISNLDGEYFDPEGLCQIESDGESLFVIEKKEYDKASGHLVIKLVDAAGNEHGTLDGIFTQSPCSYKGTFTPVRGKASDFELSGR